MKEQVMNIRFVNNPQKLAVCVCVLSLCIHWAL
jgi:hypothetical protein